MIDAVRHEKTGALDAAQNADEKPSNGLEGLLQKLLSGGQILDLNEFSIPLSALKREEGAITTLCFEMKSITQRVFTFICSVLHNLH
ncbi:unnamed protein product [Nippostrongylus brasiliensis]|uniref:Uncharacterized protein n=1 Tax=Nippostrongylus brasiliensis TaxID=27835 RepID=A0A0N4XU24_NIPBR|nr:unnamed protein product [Nippostrongylus brasiliensis]